MATKNIELLHMSGQKYKITDIPIVNHDVFVVNYYLQLLIDEVEKRAIPKDTYSFSSFVIKKSGLKEYNKIKSQRITKILHQLVPSS
ncbi:DUF2535 family protein [Alkalihalobacterium alkalinitrilicum]|uniref:DUF2535 family protein n=1 Tax=Alkalihalobacterium alkalinitrilicum TaxID=427920 RepID=UPI0009954989|nr:DUF2535 family protein [Alkalihalobacterium alkalinitrilicum]